MQITKVCVEIQVNKDIDSFLCEFQIDKKTFESQHYNMVYKIIIIERKKNCTYLNCVIGDGEVIRSKVLEAQTMKVDDVFLNLIKVGKFGFAQWTLMQLRNC